MKKYMILALLGAGIYFPALAQNKTGKYKFSSVNNFSVAIGQDAQLAGGFQSVNGIKRGNWFVGAGVGFDFYLYRSVPLFIDVRREFGEKNNRLFVYADAVLNIEWLQEEFTLKPSGWDPNLKNKYHNGFFTDAGVGYSLGTKKGNAVIFSVGHSVKTFNETRWYTDWRSGQATKETYKFNFSRVVLKAGWRF